jgi:hypothetical protein
MLQMQQQQKNSQLRLSRRNWRRCLKLPKQKQTKGKMSILRNGSLLSAKKLKEL